MSSVKLNQPAPNFQMEDFNGKNINLSDFNGESNVLIVLNRGFV